MDIENEKESEIQNVAIISPKKNKDRKRKNGKNDMHFLFLKRLVY